MATFLIALGVVGYLAADLYAARHLHAALRARSIDRRVKRNQDIYRSKSLAQRTADAVDWFNMVTEEPVQVIAAEPGTLAALTAYLREALAERLEQPAATIRIGDLHGFPLVADPALPAGEVHLRPHPRPSDGPCPACSHSPHHPPGQCQGGSVSTITGCHCTGGPS